MVSPAEWLRCLVGREDAVQPQQAAACYAAGDRLFLCATPRTGAGFSFDAEPWQRLPADSTDAELGTALLSILAGAGRVLPTQAPSGLREARRELLRAAGWRSERQLIRNCVCCHVRLEPGGLCFTPSHNGGTSGDRKGFHHQNEQALRLPPGPTAEACGAALRTALARCTSVFQPEGLH